jgi:hypothetical protein
MFPELSMSGLIELGREVVLAKTQQKWDKAT